IHVTLGRVIGRGNRPPADLHSPATPGDSCPAPPTRPPHRPAVRPLRVHSPARGPAGPGLAHRPTCDDGPAPGPPGPSRRVGVNRCTFVTTSFLSFVSVVTSTRYPPPFPSTARLNHVFLSRPFGSMLPAATWIVTLAPSGTVNVRSLSLTVTVSSPFSASTFFTVPLTTSARAAPAPSSSTTSPHITL